MGTRAISLML